MDLAIGQSCDGFKDRQASRKGLVSQDAARLHTMRSGGFLEADDDFTSPGQESASKGRFRAAAKEDKMNLPVRKSKIRHIIPISGKDSLATAIVQRTREPDLNYEFIYNDTRMELPETYEWISKVETTLGIEIIRAGKNLEAIIAEEGILPSARTRYCTRKSKIEPMHQFIGKDNAVIYIGIRADEERTGALEEKNIKVRYPLKEMSINLPAVYAIVEKVGLMPPNFFWKRVYDEVVRQLGTRQFLIKELPRYIFDRAFAWRSRPNCFMCFYQRRYEWAGLLDNHPDLFDRAEGLETHYGHSENTREHPFYWIGQDFPLSKIRDDKEKIIAKRVDALVKMLLKKEQQEMWEDSLFDEMEMAQKSCGLFCGK